MPSVAKLISDIPRVLMGQKPLSLTAAKNSRKPGHADTPLAGQIGVQGRIGAWCGWPWDGEGKGWRGMACQDFACQNVDHFAGNLGALNFDDKVGL